MSDEIGNIYLSSLALRYPFLLLASNGMVCHIGFEFGTTLPKSVHSFLSSQSHGSHDWWWRIARQRSVIIVVAHYPRIAEHAILMGEALRRLAVPERVEGVPELYQEAPGEYALGEQIRHAQLVLDTP